MDPPPTDPVLLAALRTRREEAANARHQMEKVQAAIENQVERLRVMEAIAITKEHGYSVKVWKGIRRSIDPEAIRMDKLCEARKEKTKERARMQAVVEDEMDTFGQVSDATKERMKDARVREAYAIRDDDRYVAQTLGDDYKSVIFNRCE